MRRLSVKSFRCGATGLGLLLALLWIVPSRADDQGSGLKEVYLTVGFTRAAFLNMNPSDVESAFKVLAQTVGRKRGYLITSKTRIFEDTADFEAAIKNGAVNLPIFDAWTYLAMDIERLVTPLYVSSERGQVGKQYVVLTRHGSGLNDLVDLRGKNIAALETANTTLGLSWLDTLLLTNRLGTHATFFNHAQSVGKPSAAVLPVFFGKKHACVVDTASFDVMKELNPQVGKELQSMTISESFVDAFICLSNFGWSSEGFKRDLIQALGELHLEPAGQQLLTLFKTSQLVPFKETHMETVRQLRTTHDKMRKGFTP